MMGDEVLLRVLELRVCFRVFVIIDGNPGENQQDLKLVFFIEGHFSILKLDNTKF